MELLSEILQASKIINTTLKYISEGVRKKGRKKLFSENRLELEECRIILISRISQLQNLMPLISGYLGMIYSKRGAAHQLPLVRCADSLDIVRRHYLWMRRALEGSISISKTTGSVSMILAGLLFLSFGCAVIHIRFSEWPDGMRPRSTTMPWNIRPSLIVLWGVCWMFWCWTCTSDGCICAGVGHGYQEFPQSVGDSTPSSVPAPALAYDLPWDSIGAMDWNEQWSFLGLGEIKAWDIGNGSNTSSFARDVPEQDNHSSEDHNFQSNASMLRTTVQGTGLSSAPGSRYPSEVTGFTAASNVFDSPAKLFNSPSLGLHRRNIASSVDQPNEELIQKNNEVTRSSLPKSYECNICLRKFSRKADVPRHQKSMHRAGSKEFPCPHANCDKTFPRKDNLRAHIQRKHRSKDDPSSLLPATISLPVDPPQESRAEIGLESGIHHIQNQPGMFNGKSTPYKESSPSESSQTTSNDGKEPSLTPSQRKVSLSTGSTSESLANNSDHRDPNLEVRRLEAENKELKDDLVKARQQLTNVEAKLQNALNRLPQDALISFIMGAGSSDMLLK